MASSTNSRPAAMQFSPLLKNTAPMPCSRRRESSVRSAHQAQLHKEGGTSCESVFKCVHLYVGARGNQRSTPELLLSGSPIFTHFTDLFLGGDGLAIQTVLLALLEFSRVPAMGGTPGSHCPARLPTWLPGIQTVPELAPDCAISHTPLSKGHR